MTQSVNTYYIPQNLHIHKGKIYALYINKIKNLDLSTLIPKKEINNEQQTLLDKKNSIFISDSDYKEILSLIESTEKLYYKSQIIIKKLIKERNK